jgi:Family of unknown function (DUF6527)
MRDKILQHRFVDSFPEALEAGILYVSMEYGSVAHCCCCGCGEQVVTPLTPTDWNITYDGETISLQPSIGSWTLPCRSHYVIRRNRVIEAAPWSHAQVAAERRRDSRAKAEHFGLETPTEVHDVSKESEDPKIIPKARGWKAWLSRQIKRLND